MCWKYLIDIYGNRIKLKIVSDSDNVGVNKLVCIKNTKFLVNKYKFIVNTNKIISDKIINSVYNIRLNFFIGYYSTILDTDNFTNNDEIIRFEHLNNSNLAQFYYLAKSLGYNTLVKKNSEKNY